MQRKVIPGEPVEIQAESFNCMLDAAAAHKAALSGNSVKKIPEAKTETILVRNDSGGDVLTYGILGIDGVVFDVDDNADEFYNNPCLKGVTPVEADHATKFVICQEPIADGKIGRCRIVGMSIALVDIQTSGDETCGAKTSTANLESGSGSCQIIYAPSGTGVKDCLVRFGGNSIGGVQRAKITTAPSATDDTISATLVDEVTPTPNLVGSAFDVYLRASKASVTLANHAPTLSNNGYIHVQRIGANYYLIPELLELDDCV